MQPRLLIVSNRLPVSVKKTDGKLEFFPSSGGLATGLSSYANNKRTRWIGWPGIPTDDLSQADTRKITRELQKYNCAPVFLTKKQVNDFYNGYSNSILWPLFHRQEVTEDALKKRERYWKAYRQVNEAFASAVGKFMSPKTTIWVHDYQLLLLPAMLRDRAADAKLGFFLHIPFPEPERFETLKHGEELLVGILGADLVGFHTDSYAQNFLHTSANYELGVVGSHKLIMADRVVRALDFPMGIDYKKFSQATKRRAVKQELRKLEEKYRGKKVILTVDRLDPSKGIRERVVAYQTLLRENPHLHKKVVMSMLAVPSRTEIAAYQKLKDDVERLVDDINREFGTRTWTPVDYVFDSMPFEQLSALYQRADVAFIAPLRDGMNLVAKEYVASQANKQGILILSETAGAAEELKDAIMVNHNEPKSLVRGLTRALNMRPQELRQRTTKMQEILSSGNVHVWAGNFMKTLQQSGSAASQRAHSLQTGRNRAQLVSAYKKAESRLIMLDYDGVLAPFHAKPEEAAPAAGVVEALQQLGKKPDTTLVVTSGRTKDDLVKWLGKTPVTLIAEHGSFLRPAGKSRWQSLHEPSEHEWKDIVRLLLEEYTERTPGSFVEEKSTAMVWHFRAAKPYAAQKNLVILRRLLKPLVKPFGLQVKSGHMILEIRETGTDKGTAALRFLDPEPEFCLVIGDDYTDEDMFAVMPDSAYTVKVGSGRTIAKYRARKLGEVVELLEKLAS